MFRFILMLAVATAAFAQVEGPYWVYSNGGTAPINYLHIIPDSNNTVGCFFQDGNDVKYLSADIYSGMWIEEPASLPMNGEGWIRHLYDAIQTDSGWAAVVHDENETDNRAIVYRVSNEVISNATVDSARSYAFYNEFVTNCGHWNHALSLASLENQDIIISYQSDWDCNIATQPPWFEAGSGVYSVLLTAENVVSQVSGDDFGGFFHSEQSTSTLIETASDSIIFVLGGGNDIALYVSPFEGGEISFDQQYYFFNAGHPHCILAKSSQNFFLLTSLRFGEMDSLPAYHMIQSLDSPPIAASSHPDFGIAWLSRYNHGLMLHRVDTTGAETQQPGILFWPESNYEVVEANMTIMDDGRIVALWSERLDGTSDAQVIKIASVEWNTFLATEPTNTPVLPNHYSLSAFPNPFNSVVQIQFSIPRNEQVTLATYDITGRLAATIADKEFIAGTHSATWTPSGATGVYFLQLKTENMSQIQKVFYLK